MIKLEKNVQITLSLLVSLPIIFGIVGYFVFYLREAEVKDSISNEVELQTNIITEEAVTKLTSMIWIPTTYLKSTFSEFTYDLDLVTLEENRKYLDNQFKLTYVQDNIELDSEMLSGKIALLSPSQFRPTYKAMKLGGLTYWEYDDKSKYPLWTTYEYIDGDIIPEIKTSDWTIFATGEIIPARGVDILAFSKYENYDYLFDSFREELQSADIAVGLLENPVNGNPVPCTDCMVFVGDEKTIPAIQRAGYDFLSTAGNHAGDGGQESYKRTIELLKENNIQFSGTGDGSTLNIALKQVGDVKVGMIAADEVAYYYSLADWYKTSTKENRFGVYSFGGYGGIQEEALAAMANIKEENGVDFLIVYMSWGVEYTNKANDFQKSLAHLLIDNGADLIIGSHPHWVQNIEFYKDKLIIYSLGNFIFDQQHTLETRQGMNVLLTLSGQELKNIKFYPLQSCGVYQNYNNLGGAYLNGDITLEEAYNTYESKGCIFIMPMKLKTDHKSFQQIMDRMWEGSEFYLSFSND